MKHVPNSIYAIRREKEQEKTKVHKIKKRQFPHFPVIFTNKNIETNFLYDRGASYSSTSQKFIDENKISAENYAKSKIQFMYGRETFLNERVKLDFLR